MMKTLIKQTIGFLIVLSLALSLLSLPMSAYAEEGEEVCPDGGYPINALPDAGDSYIASELSEPLGTVNQKIESGDLTVSQVYWKYVYTPEKGSPSNCYVPYGKACPADSCELVQIIIGTSGTAILKTYIAVIYRWAAGLVGIVAVLVIVISGIQISVDQGGGENVTAAKNRIMQSLAGLVILFLSALILYTINPTFFKQ